MDHRHFGSFLLLASLFLSLGGVLSPAVAQEVRVDVGSGWAIPISSVEMDVTTSTGEEGEVSVDVGPSVHMYAALGMVRPISDNLGLGVRGRVQVVPAPGRASELLSPLAPCAGDGTCSVSNRPDGQLRAATVEGRLFLTTTDWIEPYFLVGLGVVQTRVEGADVEFPSGSAHYEEVRVMDAGGDVGFGASLPIIAGLALESEIRVTGSLPGGRDSSLSVLPFTVGLSYGFGY